LKHYVRRRVEGKRVADEGGVDAKSTEGGGDEIRSDQIEKSQKVANMTYKHMRQRDEQKNAPGAAPRIDLYW